MANQYKTKLKNLEYLIGEKSQAINKIQQALSQTEHNFVTEKIKAKNNEF